jgi:hypothetical protein
MDSRKIKPGVGNGYRYEAEDPDRIMEDIDTTRERMDDTLHELGEKLRPRHIADEVFDYFRSSEHTSSAREKIKGTASKAGLAIWHKVQEHPLPSLMIGAGLVWMALEEEKRTSTTYTQGYLGETGQPGTGERIREGAARAGESARQMASGVSESAKHMASSAGESARHLAERAGEATHTVTDKIRDRTTETAAHVREAAGRMSSQVRERASGAAYAGKEKIVEIGREYPFALGIGVVALGVLAGLALPRTRTEDQLVGERSDEIKEAVRAQGEELLEKGQKAASAAAQAATEQARKEGLTPESLIEKVSHVASEAKNAAAETAEQEIGQMRKEVNKPSM